LRILGIFSETLLMKIAYGFVPASFLPLLPAVAVAVTAAAVAAAGTAVENMQTAMETAVAAAAAGVTAVAAAAGSDGRKEEGTDLMKKERKKQKETRKG
jgi:hypothetical protein